MTTKLAIADFGPATAYRDNGCINDGSVVVLLHHELH